MLTIEQILKAPDAEVVAVECPEWGGTVYVRTISADQRDAWEISCGDENDKPKAGARASLVGLAMCDKEGRFLQPTEAEVKALGAKASGPMDRLFETILRINRMRKRDVEQMEKNSEPTTADD